MPPRTSHPRLRVVSACTGKKSLACDAPLSFVELRALERGDPPPRLSDLPRAAARELYSGMQHRTLMRGLDHLPAGVSEELFIVSAGYGLVRGDELLFPYEATFSGQPRRVVEAMSRELDLHASMARLFAESVDCTLVLLGTEYLRAARLNDCPGDFSTTIILGAAAARPLAPEGALFVPLGMPEARRFGATLIALKGVLGGRFLERFTLPLPRTAEEFLERVS